MKRKIFKYKSVWVLIFLLSLFIFFLFGYGIINELDEINKNPISDHLMLYIAILIFSLNFIGLMLLIGKSFITIKFLNSYYSFLIFFLVIGLIRKRLYLNDEITYNDFKYSFIIFSSLVILIYLINKFKYKEIQYENIEEIGKHND
ncbi:hypothetical protein SAMN05421664_0126 [Chryseobacterium soldanellicola]|uniref:Uncharacterized protein n=1 Tax=Chryseobacterium soldanellicola TaxID=311333 RepID=A0A1H0XNY5_9FLAO|nr:hypothetical protein SAMN05421664_0126 [Chryseobacterium soldanellicola]